GLHSWMSEGYAVASEREQVSVGNFAFAEAKSIGTQLGWQEVREVLDDTSYVLLDTRTMEEYLGQTQKKGASRAGRIPGSIHFDWMNAVNPDQDYVFRNCQEIDSMLGERGITSTKNIITYCHTGVRSAHMAFVLKEIMGFSKVWNYDGSWTEWSYYDHLPIETGKISL
ncbi:MAG: rhodanese-like domain-containing protein, partial [Bacteroidota bacterium]